MHKEVGGAKSRVEMHLEAAHFMVELKESRLALCIWKPWCTFWW